MKKAILTLATSLVFAGLASASLVEQNGSLLFGTGLGNVPTIVTVQATGSGTTESGCVAYIGGADVFGTAACPGFVQQGAMVGLNQTQLISSAQLANGFSGPINSYANLALVVNVSQTGAATPLTLNDLTMIITNPTTGAVFRSSGVSGPDCTGSTALPCTLTPASSGTGSSGVFVFTLNSGQQTDAFNKLGAFSTSFRVGASIAASNAVGAGETVYLGGIGRSTVPEPATYGLLGAGLFLIGLVRKRLTS